MERGFTTHWDNRKASKAWDSQKKMDGLGKNSEHHGASCLGGPSVPGMLADVVGRVVPRPAVENFCESGSKVSSARGLGALWRFAVNRGRHDAMDRGADGKLTEKRETKLDSDAVIPGTAQREPETESELTESLGEAAEPERTSEKHMFF